MATPFTSVINRILSVIPRAHAHCDTADGPAVVDGRRALETGEIGYALKWIPASGEEELTSVFVRVRAVRGLSPEAAEVADRLFLETMVRLHRLAEGVGFTGIAPAGSFVEPVVVEADRALVTGDLGPVLALVPAERRSELERRFEAALARRNPPVSDVAAGRAFISAYVDFFTYAEGHEGHHAHESHADCSDPGSERAGHEQQHAHA